MENREKYGSLIGLLGIILNLLLFGFKFILGTTLNIVSLYADAMNNLSDVSSSLITLFSFKLSNKKPDKEHPYGHGRIEYVSSLLISCLILAMGLEILKESISKLINPEVLKFNKIVVIVLIVSIIIKFLMFLIYKISAKRINSNTLLTNAEDSLMDCLSTSTILISLCIYKFLGINLDVPLSIFIGTFIIINSIRTFKENMNPIIGEENEQIIKLVKEIAKNEQNIKAIHDIRVHNYGYNQEFLSLHIEIDGSLSLQRAHEISSNFKKKIKENLDCEITIHMDPR